MASKMRGVSGNTRSFIKDAIVCAPDEGPRVSRSFVYFTVHKHHCGNFFLSPATASVSFLSLTRTEFSSLYCLWESDRLCNMPGIIYFWGLRFGFSSTGIRNMICLYLYGAEMRLFIPAFHQHTCAGGFRTLRG